jgi:Flp pilus assembly protein TadB
MSGVTAATIIAGVSAAAAAGGLAYNVVNGQAQQKTQDKQLKAQKTAQDQATAQALSTQRKNEVATNAANQKTPDVASILARASSASRSGLGSTMLTGAGGVDPATLPLGGSTLLGK